MLRHAKLGQGSAATHSREYATASAEKKDRRTAELLAAIYEMPMARRAYASFAKFIPVDVETSNAHSVAFGARNVIT